MRSEQLSNTAFIRREVKRIMHCARRVRLGDVERSKIMPIILNLWPFGDGKAHIGENLGKLVHHLADRVDRPLWESWRRQRHIKPLGRKARVKGGTFKRSLFGSDGLSHGFA